MLTLRRGVVRIGWVLLSGWTAVFAMVIAFSIHAGGRDLTEPIVIFVSVPLTIFLLWRLLLWIGQGFWQHEPALTKLEPGNHPGTESIFMEDEKPWARLAFGAAGICFIAYGVYLGRLPVFPGLSGMIIYLGVFASIAQLLEWFWFSVRTRRPTH